ncbi:MAG: hypothetical protein QM731_17650 [Chitinophagaceae bacterium]
MHTLLLSLQLLLHPLSDTIQYPFPFSIKKTAVPFEWKRYELKIPAAYRDSVLKHLRPEYEQMFNNKQYLESNEYNSSFHFAELNGDGIPDVIYQGWTGSEGQVVNVYMSMKKQLKKVLQDYTNVVDLKFTGNKLSSVVIINYGCCAEYVQFERHYKVDSLSHCILVLQRAKIIGMTDVRTSLTAPEHFFDAPIRFKTLNDGYALRYSARINDTIPEPEKPYERMETKGNILTLYPRGSYGIAWGSRTDNIGRVWWLVEMDPQLFIYDQLYSLDNKPTHYFGWMSSRFVEKLP